VVAGDSVEPRTSHVTDVHEGQEDTDIGRLGRLGRVVEGYYFVFCVVIFTSITVILTDLIS